MSWDSLKPLPMMTMIALAFTGIMIVACKPPPQRGYDRPSGFISTSEHKQDVKELKELVQALVDQRCPTTTESE